MIEKIYQDVLNTFKDDKKRLKHIIGVKETAIKLAKQFDVDESKLTLAAYLHDITKGKPLYYHKKMIETHFSKDIIEAYSAPLYHAFSAAAYAKVHYGIEDEDILNAIKHHTVGRPGMPSIEKILFISDYVEPNRPYKICHQVRDIAFKDVDLAIYQATDHSINLFAKQKHVIPKIAYATRDYYQVSSKQYDAFETERLKGYFAKKADAEIFHRWWRDGELMASVGFEDGINISQSQIEKQFEQMLLNVDSTKVFIVYDKKTHQPIAEASFGEFDPKKKSARIGLKICDLDKQGKGYGKELVLGLIRFLKTRYHVKTVLIDTLSKNKPAQNLYESIGAIITEVKKDFWQDPKGHWHDAIFYRLEGDAYEKA